MRHPGPNHTGWRACSVCQKEPVFTEVVSESDESLTVTPLRRPARRFNLKARRANGDEKARKCHGLCYLLKKMDVVRGSLDVIPACAHDDRLSQKLRNARLFVSVSITLNEPVLSSVG